MAFGSLGFVNRVIMHKVVSLQVLDTLKGYYVSQVSIGLYNTIVVTNMGGFLVLETMRGHNLGKVP